MGKLWQPDPRYSRPRAQRYYNYHKKPWERAQESRFLRKLLWQTVASVVIFLLLLGIFQMPYAFFKPVQATVRGWFTEDYSIEPVLKFFSSVGLWGDTFERAALEASQPAPSQLTVPVSGQITKPFGWIINSDNTQAFHDGIVIVAPENTPVRAALAGKVTRIANEEELGRVVEITDEQGFVTTYGHCKEILVNLNADVSSGQVIARVGKTGKAGNAQLFFRIAREGESLDPARFFIPASET